MKKTLKILIPLIVGVIIAFIPAPEGLDVFSMRFMGIFVCALLWMVLKALPDHITVLLAMTASVFFGVGAVSNAYSYFASSTIWLLVGAFGIGAAINSCGLLKRISMWILKLFPENYKGQVLAMYATGTVISPLIPSLAAKVAMLAPFTVGMSQALGFKKSSKQAAGMFAAMFIPGSIFGMAFYSGAVPVFTVLGFLSEEKQAEWNWFSWIGATWVWLIVLAVLCYVAILLIYKPEKGSEIGEVQKGFAKAQLEALGPMTKNEKTAIILLAIALIGWMTTKWTNFDSGMIAVLVLAIMTICGLFAPADWKNKIPWTTVIFIAGVFSLAAYISSTGISGWLAGILAPILSPVVSNSWLLIPVVVLATYAIRTVVISQTAAITIIFTIFGSVCDAAGISVWPVLFTCYVSTLVWYYAANNTTFATAFGATNDELVEFKDTLPLHWAFMVCNFIACVASVPLWKMLGML